ncbi:MAG: DUF1989 domain-containing protein, partial [Pseudomonadota bacterium]|nr:DUF1989 domain-containing protein [Pseudomonadota bacterium]
MLDLPTASAPSTAARTSLILRPGIVSLPPGLERYRIRGQGSIVVPVGAGDEITLIDVEGGQTCEIGHVDRSGRFDAAAIDARATNAAEGLKSVLSDDNESARRTRLALERRSIDIGKAGAVEIFGGQSKAGARATFPVLRDGLVIAAAPGRAMHPGEQTTATPIELLVKRRGLQSGAEATALPEPLADPLQDIRVVAATAQAYVVKAGEYIQVIDVAGRQCSDFQCFSLRKIDKGVENALDATVTRTLTGRSYPTPGLPSKAYGRDFEPLVEIVQDTVGRHDAFATACNSRYYDDMGYPGHAN